MYMRIPNIYAHISNVKAKLNLTIEESLLEKAKGVCAEKAEEPFRDRRGLFTTCCAAAGEEKKCLGYCR